MTDGEWISHITIDFLWGSSFGPRGDDMDVSTHAHAFELFSAKVAKR